MSEQRRLVEQDLFRFRLVGAPVIASHGRRAAFVEQYYVAGENITASRIGVVTLADGRVVGEPRYTAGPRDSSPVLSPDGSLLAFVRKAGDSAAQLWLMRTDGGEAWRLTSLHSGASNPRFSSDGKRLVFVTRFGAEGPQDLGYKPVEDDFAKFTKGVKVIERLHYKHDGEGYFGDKRSHIAIVDVAPAPQPFSAIRLLTSGDFDHRQPTFSPDGQWVLFAAHRSMDADWQPNIADIWAVPAEGGEPVRLTESVHGCSTPTVSPDGRLVAFLAAPPGGVGYWGQRLWVVDGPAVPDRPSQPRLAAPSFPGHWGNVASADLIGPGEASLYFSEDGQWVYGTVSDAGIVVLVAANPHTGEVRRLTGGDQVVYATALAPAAGVGVLGIAHPTSPGDLYTIDLNQPSVPYAVPAERVPGPLAPVAEVRQITGVNDALFAEVALSAPERFFYQPEGGPLVDGWVMAPVTGVPAQGKVPLVLEIHGGPQAMYAASFFLEFQILAAQGYAVVYTNPRGSLSYGDAFCDCIVGQWGDKDYTDVMAGLDAALVKYPWLDADRMGVAGGSYGGFVVNWIIGNTNRFKAAFTMRSVVNRHSAMGTADGGYDRLKQYGPLWWEDPAPYWQQSPLRFASNMVTPVLIEHQEEDYRLTVDQAEQLFAALKFQRRTVKMVRYPAESHGMSRGGKPWHRVHRLKTIREWFAEYL